MESRYDESMKLSARAKRDDVASAAVNDEMTDSVEVDLVRPVGGEPSGGEGASACGPVSDDSDTGVESSKEDPEQTVVERPFDPSKIKVRTEQVVVDQIVSRIEHDEIDLAPDFQRMRGIWDVQRRSRLIESLLLRIPIPVFYVAADHDERWAVVDGVQRISTVHDYMTGLFPLTRLEYRLELTESGTINSRVRCSGGSTKPRWW